MNKKEFLAIAALTVLLVALATYLRLGAKPTLRGSVIEPRAQAAEIGLQASDGRGLELRDLRGSVALIFFGYTHCPDECPLAMANLKVAVEELGPEGKHTQVIFITTDPDRDTPEALDRFLQRFNSKFIGLTGPREDLVKVWKDYGVTVMDGGATHSRYIYVIDKTGNLVETVLSDSNPDDIAADVRTLLKED